MLPARILIVGSRGQLGTEFERWLPPRPELLGVDRDEVAGERGSTLVHFSTDFVFDGHASVAYMEEDEPRPLSVYAASKLRGEAAAALCPRHYVVRLSSLYGGRQKRTYIDRIADTYLRGEPVPLFTDRFVSPSYTREVVEAVVALVREEAAPGVYHCVSSGYCSWHELGTEIARQLGVSEDLARPLTSDSVRQVAHRPRFCALSNKRLADRVFKPAHWKVSVASHLNDAWSAGERSAVPA